MKDEKRVVQATRDWVEKVVIGYNFCPFAKPVFVPDLIRYQVEHSDNVADMLETLYLQCRELQASADVATTLIILPSGVEDFEDYLDMLSMAEQLIERSGFAGEFQLASFHPAYLFDGEPDDSPSHFTNRSPYPMLHIIREADIEKAMKNKDDAAGIYERNMRKATELGTPHFEKILSDVKSEPR